jgi:hypothetical protein
MFTALVTHRLAVTKSAKATTTWPLVLQQLATSFSSHGGVVFKSLAMVAIVANTVYLGWAADHNDSWCEGLHIFSRISVQTSKTLKKKVNLAILSIHVTHITHNTCQPSVGTCTLCEVEAVLLPFSAKVQNSWRRLQGQPAEVTSRSADIAARIAESSVKESQYISLLSYIVRTDLNVLKTTNLF